MEVKELIDLLNKIPKDYEVLVVSPYDETENTGAFIDSFDIIEGDELFVLYGSTKGFLI